MSYSAVLFRDGFPVTCPKCNHFVISRKLDPFEVWGCRQCGPYSPPRQESDPPGAHTSSSDEIFERFRSAIRDDEEGALKAYAKAWEIVVEGAESIMAEEEPSTLEALQLVARASEDGMAIAQQYLDGCKCFSFDTGYMGNDEHWCYWPSDYPDEGSCGPFDSLKEAILHAREDHECP